MATQNAKQTKCNVNFSMETIQSDKDRAISSEFTTSNNFLRLEIVKPRKKFCRKPTELYPTRYP